MSFDLEKIWESKRALRRSLARRPLAEKMAMLEQLRDQALAIRRASLSRQAISLRENSPEFGSGKSPRQPRHIQEPKYHQPNRTNESQG